VVGNDLAFTMKMKEFPYGMFSEAFGMSGEKIEIDYNYMTAEENGVSIHGLSTRKEPIKLKLSFYPSWIKGNEKIRIK
jgi:hypothetical protein